MASPKSTRTAPARVFENYVLTRNVGPGTGLTRIHQNRFTPILSIGAGAGDSDHRVSDFVPIGFNFLFDGTTYTNIVVSDSGWLVLADPTKTTANTAINDVLDSAISGSYSNEGISATNSSKSTLCAVWFDELSLIGSDTPVSGTVQYNQGITTPVQENNHSAFGMGVCYDFNHKNGRRTIVRWNSYNAQDAIGSAFVKFECVLYENGTIEFRYDKKSNNATSVGDSSSAVETSATMGIFASGSYRFRDFAYGFGKDRNRKQYKYGGAVYDANYVDSYTDVTEGFISRPYVISLNPNVSWPGSSEVGATYRFTPPLARQRVLPRVLQNKLDSYVNPINYFDDRKSPSYINGVVVNYPTTLPRLFSDQSATVQFRQDVFGHSGNELELTGSVVKSAIEQFIDPVIDDHEIHAFNEHQNQISFDDTFFSSGSIEFSHALQSKSQIQFSLNVDYVTTLLGTTSSIYYYNSAAKAWLLPRNSVIYNEDTGATETDLCNPQVFLANYQVLEDPRGFGPVGNLVSSGSNIDFADGVAISPSDAVIGSSFSLTPGLARVATQFSEAAEFVDSTTCLTREMTKTITINPSYEGSSDELFSLPSIEKPFLLEKAVFDIPYAAGSGWFNDKTKSFIPLSPYTGSFDFGGPGLTLALFNQVTVGSTTQRDLILTGTITHENDNNKTVELSNFQPFGVDFQLRPSGFLSYGTPSCVVPVPSNNVVTGTLRIKTEALVSNGVMLRMSKDMVTTSSVDNQTQLLNLIDQEMVLLVSGGSTYDIGFGVAYVNTFGRSSTGQQSPRSIMGGEFVTSQGKIINGKIRNPFYVTGSAREEIVNRISSVNKVRAISAVSLETHARSPYLLKPGDKLILALAKTRPHFYSTLIGGPDFSGSISHDFQLMSGTINVTLYGSYLRENEEISFSKEVQKSKVVHDTIGNDPILDEYDGHYRNELIGSTLDDYLTGTLVSRGRSGGGAATILITGSRGRVFSKYSARDTAPPDTHSKNFNLQPWFERAGNHVAEHVDSSERFYDSMMPNFSDAYSRDGAVIFVGGTNIFASAQKVLDVNNNIGRILLNLQREGGFATAESAAINSNWTYSFPFEPRYARIARQTAIEKSFVAKRRYGSGGITSAITPKIVDGLIIGFYTSISGSYDDSAGVRIKWFADVNPYITNSFGYHLTSTLSPTDATKLLYGFGDLRGTGYTTFTGMSSTGHNGPWRLGANYLPESRDVDDQDDQLDRYSYSPIIRGWKYGVYSGLPTYSKAYFRSNRYGQLRDMLEQRPTTKFHINNSTVTSSPVQVRFLNTSGNPTRPENTQSQNLSFEATSSLPYFDAEIRNRTDINPNTQNTNIVSLTSDEFNNVVL